MRAFIAIELSDEIKDILDRTESHLKYSGADVKWVAKENIHLTLKFLGEIDKDRCEKVKSSLEAMAKSVKPFDMLLKDVGAFPDVDHPRVIWVGLDKGAQESVELAARIDAAMSEIGFEKETRPFTAHLTIGRVRSQKNNEALREKIRSLQFPVTSCQLPERISSITLFKSTLTQQGPIYTKLHEARLK